MKNTDKDVLILKKEEAQDNGGWRPITVSTNAYLTIKALAEETNQPISKIACMLIEFAVERVVIEK